MCWLSLWSAFLRIFSDSCPCVSSRSHCCVETFDIPLSFVILHDMYAFIIMILLWFFPYIVEKDYLLKPSGSCPGFATLWLNTFVTIVVVPPGLYLDCHVIFVSNVFNYFLTRIVWLLSKLICWLVGLQSVVWFRIDQQYRC